MNKFEIIKYNSSYKEKLFLYLKRIGSNNSDKYIEYCLSRSEDEIPAIIVVDESDNVVGCQLFFTTEAFVKGEQRAVAWGHETYLNEEYRSYAGLEFVIAINCDYIMGIGLSDINRKLQKKLKNVIVDTAFNYFYIDIFFPWGIVKKLFKTPPPSLKNIESVKAKVTFNLVHDASEIIIPNNGFWFKHKIEYDIIRDQNFINYRFINNSVYNYSVYEYHNDNGDSCYFVVRPILFRGIPTLLLVDYRYIGDERLLDYILACVKKIARKNQIGVIQTTGAMKDVENAFESLFCIKRPAECVIHKSLKPKSSDYISITPADSDVDFNR